MNERIGNSKIYALAKEAGLIEFEQFAWNPELGSPTYESVAKARKFAELILAEAFRAGMLYSAKKYAAVCEDRFTGNDVAMFLEMEACELSDEDIKQHFGVEE